MNDKFAPVSSRVFAVIFTVMFFVTLIGMITNKAWWHIYTLIVTAILAVAFWTEKEDPSDNSPI
jgi:uncharacterized membrane protein